MLKFKSITGVIAFVTAITLAFAFTPKKAVVADAALLDYVWIKYDCALDPAPVPGTPSNPNFVETEFESGVPYPDCEDEVSICAIKYLKSQTIEDGEGNRRPVEDATEVTVVQCAAH